MGAPKQKWTGEEEAALKAGVVKHGAGKWRNILKDPEFDTSLRNRSNIDLKDKWRNLTGTTTSGSRKKKENIVHTQYLSPPKVENNNQDSSGMSRLDHGIASTSTKIREETRNDSPKATERNDDVNLLAEYKNIDEEIFDMMKGLTYQQALEEAAKAMKEAEAAMTKAEEATNEAEAAEAEAEDARLFAKAEIKKALKMLKI